MPRKEPTFPQRCPTCQELNSYILKAAKCKVTVFRHHKSFDRLEVSSSDGCDLCRYLRTLLILNCDTYQSLASSNSPIEIKKSFLGYGTRRERLRHFEVMCGDVQGVVQPPSRWSSSFFRGKNDLGNSASAQVLSEDIEKDLKLAKSWLLNCLTTHIHCGERPASKLLPRRLIDVGRAGSSSPPKLIATTEDLVKYFLNKPKFPELGHASFYCTLSYCWGANSNAPKLTPHNINQFMEGIPWDILPKTIQDAITIVRYIGVGFLWVDALCIIQPDGDDNLDWVKESARMGDIYRNSLCTITATGAKNSDEGCFLQRHWKQYPAQDCKLQTSSSALRKLIPPLALKAALPTYNSILGSPAYKRGWIFQEQTLSPRLLHWTKEGVMWQCRVQCESQWYPYSRRRQMPGYNSMRPISLMSDALFAAINSKFDGTLDSWFRIVGEFSSKKLTHVSDTLVALSGIAKEFRRHSNDEYLAGLWRSQILDCLTWSRRATSLLSSDGTLASIPAAGNGENDALYVAPSWSWASKPSISVGWLPSLEAYQWSATVDHTRSFVRLSSEEDPTGAVTYGQLCITAHFYTIITTEELSGDPHRFYTAIDPPGGLASLRYDDLGAQETSHFCFILYSAFEGSYFGLIIKTVEASEKRYQRLGIFELVTLGKPLSLLSRETIILV